MSTSRQKTPVWGECGLCQLYGKPFFWNLLLEPTYRGRSETARLMPAPLSILLKGCLRKKCTGEIVIPSMGFEITVRVCERFHKALRGKERHSIATFHDAKHSIGAMNVEKTKIL